MFYHGQTDIDGIPERFDYTMLTRMKISFGYILDIICVSFFTFLAIDDLVVVLVFPVAACCSVVAPLPALGESGHATSESGLASALSRLRFPAELNLVFSHRPVARRWK